MALPINISMFNILNKMSLNILNKQPLNRLGFRCYGKQFGDNIYQFDIYILYTLLNTYLVYIFSNT